MPESGCDWGLVVCVMAAIDIIATLSFGLTSEWWLISACVLLILAYVVAKRKNSRLKRRMLLLTQLGDLSNPRFGFEAALTTALDKLRAFCDADECLLINPTQDESGYFMSRILRDLGTNRLQSNRVSAECASRLLVVPENEAFVSRRSRLSFFARRYVGYDLARKKRLQNFDHRIESVLAMLDAECAISVPVLNQNSPSGRVFLTSNRKRAFSGADLEFLSEFVARLLHGVENIRLVDTLTASARERERQRVALDIHDSVIQRCIGMQLGVEAIRQKIEAGNSDIVSDLEKLERMTNLEVTGLRLYTQQLSGPAVQDGDLVTAVRRLSDEFSSATGIAVTVKSGQHLKLADAVAAEAFQMIAEGLSNIRRHTTASEAVIEIDSSSQSLNLTICNNGRNGETRKFLPKSITSRAALLGGAVDIQLVPPGKTLLSIGIPM